MSKRIAVSTWCTDDYVDLIGVQDLVKSFKHFHPDIDFFIFDSKMTDEAKVTDPWLQPVWMMAPTCIPFIEDYDMVVHIDGDSVVTGPLTELFESDEDIIGVRNNNSLGKASSHQGITIAHLNDPTKSRHDYSPSEQDWVPSVQKIDGKPLYHVGFWKAEDPKENEGEAQQVMFFKETQRNNFIGECTIHLLIGTIQNIV
jgi:hypothetical protein